MKKSILIVGICVVILSGLIMCIKNTTKEIGVVRLAGNDRLQTSYVVVDTLLETMNKKKFDHVIITSGSNFADALSGSYLSASKKAPVVLTLSSKEANEQTREYIKTVLKENGTVYILGGTSAVVKSMETDFEGYNVKRVAGKDRLQTNLEILKEVGVNNITEILVCTAQDYADSLSASATGQPLLLVSNKLTKEQKEFLSSLQGLKFTIIGGKNAVSKAIEKELSVYGEVNRLAGENRVETSVLVAQTYFKNAENAVITYGWNFPDGLCGSSLAHALQAPLLLTNSTKSMFEITANYTNELNIHNGYVLGGSGLVSDEAAQTIFSITTLQESK